ncbi:WG repeat-containing protein [Flavisolibacter nicotianae]|uniref:WG repeat-containing protein n=1 Tax=Flavisolibacter nicotianae TaxID=2364882 RepID=UPI000EAFBBED|nr:WG repeat-containing protein [Flavisolibacter nicotianae]
MTISRTSYLFFVGLFCFQAALGQKKAGNSPLVSYVDTANDGYGYKNLHGDIIIPAGKYSFCFTDTFRTYAVVSLPPKGFVAIDRKENILYTVFPFDNGPDYVEDGLFRIVKDGKIGFADAATGKIVIQPQFACAWPFEKGRAKVSLTCETKSFGEHSTWISDKWFYIDKQGRKIRQPSR